MDKNISDALISRSNHSPEVPHLALVDLSDLHRSVPSQAGSSKPRDLHAKDGDLIITPISSVLTDRPGSTVLQPGHGHAIKHAPNHPSDSKQHGTTVHRPKDSTAQRPAEKTPEPDPLLETHSAWGQHAYLRAKETMTPANFENFKRFMHDFEGQNHNPAEVAGTYQQISRLLDADGGAIPQADRTRVALDIMLHASHPEEIGQGSHNTCGLAALESREFARTPSRAAELIATAALTGKWTAPDGKQIQLDTKGLQAGSGGEERFGFERSLASQIFQLVTTNDITQRLPTPIFFNGAGSDALTYANNQPAQMNGSKSLEGLPPFLVAQAGQRDFGDSNFFLVSKSAIESHHIRTDGLSQFGSPQELQTLLSQSKSFPMLVAVDGRVLYGAMGVPNHILKVVSFDAQSGDVTLADPNFPGLSGEFSLDDLYAASKM